MTWLRSEMTRSDIDIASRKYLIHIHQMFNNKLLNCKTDQTPKYSTVYGIRIKWPKRSTERASTHTHVLCTDKSQDLLTVCIMVFKNEQFKAVS